MTVSFIFVVELYFLMYNVNYSVFLLRISFYMYACPGAFHAAEKDNNAAGAGV